jgi:FdhD protein
VGTSGSERFEHLQIGADGCLRRNAAVAVEEPLEIRLGSRPVAVAMRTPGNDAELALGFLLTEGVIEDPASVLAIADCPDGENVVEVRVDPAAPGVHPPTQRSFFASSSCGVCGKATLESVRVRARDVRADPLRISAARLAALPARLRGAQPLFDLTGALHGAALFDRDDALVCVREDVGRHNAVDKVIGFAAARERLPLAGHVLVVSGRAGFEIVQKAAVAGIPVVCAISGPSSLAVELARESGLTLVAFLRGEQMNVYSGAERIEP